MSNLWYPNFEELNEWVEFLQKDVVGTIFLPPNLNQTWITCMLRCFQLTAIHPDGQDLFQTAARLFYKIVKNHVLVDGNKRSAVICTFYFFIENHQYLLIPPEEMYLLAIEIASSPGSEFMDVMIQNLSEVFQKTTKFSL